VSSVFRVYEPGECGKDGYPHAWKSIDGGPGIKHLVRAEAGDRCVRCGHPYAKGAGEWSPCDDNCAHAGELRVLTARYVIPIDQAEADGPFKPTGFGRRGTYTVEARWRILTVHHLNGQKHDCRWWNLCALCQRCHLQIQGKVVMERIWPWPHSEWFKVYAAGWYAAAYLGLDLSREETLARIDELLALELAAQ
jgi:hypothetical protein